MNYPRLSDDEREALQDEYSVIPAAISDEGISRQAADRMAEIAKDAIAKREALVIENMRLAAENKNVIKERDVAREGIEYALNFMNPDKEDEDRLNEALNFRAEESEQKYPGPMDDASHPQWDHYDKEGTDGE